MPICMKDAYDAFREYVRDYEPDDPKIALKISHILRVAQLQRREAHVLGASELDIALAELIGLLHDIGRFEQIRIYDSFKDFETVDHAALGCDVLFGHDGDGHGIIRRFVQEDDWDDVIMQAIFHHNKLNITNEDDMDDRTLFHARLIRDTDKVDNFKVNYEEPNIALFGHDNIVNDVMSDAVYDDYFRGGLVDKKLVRNSSAADSIVCLLGFIHDLNFDASCKEILDGRYLEMLPQRYRFNDRKTNERLQELIDNAVAECGKRAASVDYTTMAKR